MKFLVDAQLPRKLSVLLTENKHDSIHTLELPLKNSTSDADVARIADLDGRIVVTKDADFVTSHLLHGSPAQLLLISSGNISNLDLLRLMEINFETIAIAFHSVNFVELNASALVLHR